MKKKIFVSIVVSLSAVTVLSMLLTGCGKGAGAAGAGSTEAESGAGSAEADPGAGSAEADPGAGSAERNAGAENAEIAGGENESGKIAAPYFKKGVYVNYAKEAQDPPLTYFYVFDNETCGHTDDGTVGIGVPFRVTQKDGVAEFSFGGDDEESKDELVITSFENDIITGYFEDVPDRELVFELMTGLDAESFSAENYVNGPENSVYHDANGWSIRYDEDLFDIDQKDNQVFIVYTGESAGTNMITVTYTVDSKAEAAIKELGESWGDNVTFSQGSFPGAAEGVKGYRASLPPAGDGSGLYMEAVGRDYMDGALIFELTGHQGEDDEQNMAVSDQLASIIDSLVFDFENTEQ